MSFIDHSPKYPKKVMFPKFTLSNTFRNNICFLDDGSIIVWNDFKNEAEELINLTVVGRTFLCFREAFKKPFSSLKYEIKFGSHLSDKICEFPAHKIVGKIYAVPLKPFGNFDFLDVDLEWYFSPLFHSLDD